MSNNIPFRGADYSQPVSSGKSKVYFSGKVATNTENAGGGSPGYSFIDLPAMTNTDTFVSSVDDAGTNVFDGTSFTAPRDGIYKIDAHVNCYKSDGSSDHNFDWTHSRPNIHYVKLKFRKTPNGGSEADFGAEAVSMEDYDGGRATKVNLTSIMSLSAGDAIKAQQETFSWPGSGDGAYVVGLDTGMSGMNID
jgi:hypothetical protein